MSGVLKIEIAESVETLKQRLNQSKNTKQQQKLQVLYWLKTKQAESVGQLSVLVGKHRTSVSRWLSQYRREGLEALLDIKKRPGRPRIISQEIEDKLQEELKDKERFSSYKEIQKWLEVFWNLSVDYTTVHKLVRYRLKGELKVPRPLHIKQEEGAIEEF